MREIGNSQLIVMTKKMSMFVDARISVSTFIEEFQTFEKQWEDLFSHYRLLLEFGYESNKKMLTIKKLLQQLEQDQFIRQLYEATDAAQLQILYTIYFQEILQLLKGEQLELPKVNKQPFLVNAWSTTLQILEKFSLFYILRCFLLLNYTKGNYRLVDRWIILHTVLAITYVVIADMDGYQAG